MPPKEAAIIEVSLVPAPRCENCMHTMVPYDSIHWTCTTLDCIEKGKPIHTGVYPLNEKHLIVDDIEGPPPTQEQKEAMRRIANARMRAVLDEHTCDACRARHDDYVFPVRGTCTSELGCRCVIVTEEPRDEDGPEEDR